MEEDSPCSLINSGCLGNEVQQLFSTAQGSCTAAEGVGLAGVAVGTPLTGCCHLSRAEQPSYSWQGSGLLQQPLGAGPWRGFGGHLPHCQFRRIAAAKGVCGGLDMGLEHPLPCRVQRCVQHKAERNSMTLGGHQLASLGHLCCALASFQLEELPELSPLPGPCLQREMQTLSW